MATGAVQYAFTGDQYNIPIGIVTGGEWGDNANSTEIAGIGGYGIIIPGAQTTRATLDVVPVDNACLLDKVLKTSYPAGMPPAFQLSIGDDDDGRQGAQWHVNSAEITLAAEEALTVSYELIMLGKPLATTNTSQYAPAKTPLLWFAGAVTLDGADCDAQSVKISIDHGITPRFDLNAKLDGSRRHPDGGDAGAEKIEVTLECFEPPGFDLLADDLPVTDLVVSARNMASTTTTWTFTLNNCKVVSTKSSLVGPDDVRMWTIDLRSDWNIGTDVSSVLS